MEKHILKSSLVLYFMNIIHELGLSEGLFCFCSESLTSYESRIVPCFKNLTNSQFICCFLNVFIS